MVKSAFLFPGQGSQYVGMGKELSLAFPLVKELFEELDDVLGYSLSRIMLEGPADELTLTRNTQPALMAHSLAVYRILEKEAGFTPSMAAGHSLGEYSALCAAGVFDFATTASLLKIRGTAMQDAVPVGKGGMAALLGTDRNQAEILCAQVSQPDSIVVVANDNGASQIVVSGHLEAVDRIIVAAKEAGLRRVVKLPVSAPFHSPLMQPAAQEMEQAFRQVTPAALRFPVVANVTAQPYSSAEEIPASLVQQVTGSVRWAETMQCMLDQEVEVFFEIGAGKVLSKIMQRTAPDRQVYSVDTPEDIDQFVNVVSRF